MPDDELARAGRAAELGQPDVLRGQVERMLSSPKAAAFTENFVGQWLGLRDIDFTEPSHILYPEFDHMLKVSMVRETELFFDEMLKDDLSLTNFVASDFTMLNGRLAKHYGIPGVEGWEFRKVTLPPDSHRGGVLTMAERAEGDGQRHHDLAGDARGLGAGPHPGHAPAAAARGRARRSNRTSAAPTTIREQLAKHRTVASCAACHAKIDPPGFALESFDVIGGWRDNYRSTGNGRGR